METKKAGLRRDAEDNRQRLLTAAREVFGKQGIQATLHDVARRAGVGIGTAYRRFANKEELLDSLLVMQVDELELVLLKSLAEYDAWNGLVYYLEQALLIQANDRAIAQILSGSRIGQEKHDWMRDRLAPLVNKLVERAVLENAVRSDLTGTDLIFLQIGLSSIAETTRKNAKAVSRDDVETLYRRYLWIFLDGIRTGGSHTPLPVPALSTDETHQLLS